MNQNTLDSSTTKHLSEIELEAFISMPASEATRDLRLHLVNCEDCRVKLQLLQNTQQFIQNHATALCQSNDNQTSELKAQLHQITHELAMEAAMEHREPAGNNKPSISLLQSLSTYLSGLRQTLRQWHNSWLAIPSTALATLAAAWLFIGFNSSYVATDSSELLSFQDSDGLILQPITQDKPGLGFFHQSRKPTITTYAGFSVRRIKAAGLFEVSWPPVIGAEAYNIALYEVVNNNKREIERANINGNTWQVKADRLTSGRLYRLELSGKTQTNSRFRHNGGFIFAE